MKSKYVRKLFIALNLFLLLISKFALSQEIIFSRLSTNDGLRSNFIYCVWQDEKGFIWVGSVSGLQRYDGNKFISIYNKSTDQSLPSLPVHQIIGDKKHQMWLRMGQIVGRYDLKTNRFIKAKTSNFNDYDCSLWTDSKGSVYLTYSSAGVFKYNEKNNSFEPCVEFKIPATWKPITVFEDVKTNRYWIGGASGLGVYDGNTKQFYYKGYNPLHIPLLDKELGKYLIRFFIDSKRRYWFVTWPEIPGQTFYKYNETSDNLTVEYVQSDIPGYFEMNGFKEYNGYVWTYGANLLNILGDEDSKFSIFYDHKNYNTGIKFYDVLQVYQDADKNIWVATDNGLYTGNVLSNNIRHGFLPLVNTDITFAQTLSNGHLVIGSWGKGVFPLIPGKDLAITDDSILKKNIYKGMPQVDIGAYHSPWSLLEHSVTKHLWIGCQGGTLMDYDPVKQKTQFIRDTTFRHSTIKEIVEDHDHNIWFGSYSGKLVKVTPNGKFNFIRDVKSYIAKMIIDTKGFLWIATGGKGIFVVDPKTGSTVKEYHPDKNADKGLSYDGIKDIVQVNDSIYAVACLSNLDILNIKTGKVKHLTIYDGLPQPVINCMVTDNRGQLWFATYSGIARYNFQKNEFRSYDQKDGLISTTDTKNQMVKCLRLANGNLVFAGGDSFLIFSPDAIRDIKAPKDVTITDIKLFDKYLPVDSIESRGGLTLNHNQNSITIQFASLSYTQRSKLNYYYKLVGIAEDWVKAENSLTASYVSLMPGHYTFMVKCDSPDGLGSLHTTALDIYIKPAFWQTWCFIVLLIILAALPVYVIYKLRINRLLAVQKLREKVARDLHDDMGSTLTSINILSDIANVKLTGDNQLVKDYLIRISTNSNQMMDAMDDIVWSINPANDTMPRIVARMREYAATVLEPRDIDYTVTNVDRLKNIKLDMDVRRNLFLIYKETLNNLVKYSQATQVQIEFEVNQSMLQLTIKDNGIGFDQETVTLGNGLVNMRKRANGMKGSFNITSQKNMGTVVILQIPIT